MAIILTDSRLGKTGMLGGMRLGPLPPAAAAALRATQGALEVVQEPPPSSAVRATQGALEAIQFPPNDVWATQVCLEVIFPADGFVPPTPTPGRRNHTFFGSMWQSTGHGFNASFND